jgi:phosphatidylinositol alpha-1,6-mannosyltransferase
MPDGDTEGFGLVFLEANACGKPVISGRAGGVVEAVRDGINGLQVQGEDIGAIAKAVSRLLNDDALYRRLADGGLEAARLGDWRSRTAEFLALCDRLGAVNGRQPS